MSVEFAFRLVGMIVIGLLGGYGGSWLAVRFAPDEVPLYTSTFSLLGGALGLVLTPFLTTRPVRALRMMLGRISAGGWLADCGPAGLPALAVARTAGQPAALSGRADLLLPGHLRVRHAPGRHLKHGWIAGRPPVRR